MKIKIGDMFKLYGHILKVVKIEKSNMCVNRVHLNCAPHCCTTPCHCELTIAESHLVEIIEAKQKSREAK